MEASIISKTLSTTIAPFVFHRLRHSTSLFPLSSAAAARRFSRAYRLPDYPHSPFFSFSGHRALRCSSRPDVPLPGPGGGDGNKLPGAGGGGGGGGDSDDARNVVNSATVDAAGSSEVIILDVGGMSCGGCAASVKRILEIQPQVSTASVNLTTETAIIWPKSEAKTVPNWQKELGDALAKHLTSCGFKSNLRGHEHALSWALCAVCLLGRVTHFLGSKASWIHSLHSRGFHLSLSLLTLIGPGRALINEGLRNLVKGTPEYFGWAGCFILFSSQRPGCIGTKVEIWSKEPKSKPRAI